MYLTENTLRLHYKAQPVNAVYCENHTKHTNCVGKMQSLCNVEELPWKRNGTFWFHKGRGISSAGCATPTFHRTLLNGVSYNHIVKPRRRKAWPCLENYVVSHGVWTGGTYTSRGYQKSHEGLREMNFVHYRTEADRRQENSRQFSCVKLFCAQNK
jgi:hypothetical protein